MWCMLSIYVVYVQYTWCMLIVLGICFIYVQHTWCMLSALVEYRLCMFSIYSVCEVYVVYGVYMWSIHGVHVLPIGLRELCLDYVVHVEYA